MILLLIVACGLKDLIPVEPVVNCDPRTAYYLDQDSDGVGSTDQIYIGCEAPEGYVDEAGDCDDEDPNIVTGCHDTAGNDTGLE